MEALATTSSDASCRNREAAATSTTTTVYFIRHGRSVSNEWMEGSPENGFGAPTYSDYNGNVRDAPLSPTGLAQAKALCRTLQQQQDDDDDASSAWLQDDVQLIAVSPLTRCIETFVHGVAPAIRGSTHVCVAPLLRERVYTLSETGRPFSVLRQQFQTEESNEQCWDWSACDETDSDEWWYTKPHDASTKEEEEEEWRPLPGIYAVPGEPQVVFDQRMEELRQWLCHRPEQCILAVAHWGVIQHFAPQDHIDNCQVVRVELAHDR